MLFLKCVFFLLPFCRENRINESICNDKCNDQLNTTALASLFLLIYVLDEIR